METPDSTALLHTTGSHTAGGTAPAEGTGGRPARRRAGLAATALAGAMLLLPSTAGAAPTAPTALGPGDTAKVAKLTSQIKTLEKQYRGELGELRDTRLAATRALGKSSGLKRDLANARAMVAQIAAAQYMSNGVDPSVAILATDDPSTVLNGATMASHLSNNYAAQVKQIQSLIDAEQKANREAKDKIEKLEKSVANLGRQRARIQKLIDKYKPESPVVGGSGLTSRTIAMRTEIDREFGPFGTIGCLRPGDPGEHGKGRACDFMESTGGNMPTADRQAHGDRVADYAIRNASRLGIMYIIWKQRIYDMRSPGWKMMSNRGGITANHFDHVHISMF